ncbi:MAG TPA: hypothetical protein VK604_28295 [Bryobacteraceae bacterium]|nr:hypothetical protein [Bryobacteraceae bacterium]
MLTVGALDITANLTIAGSGADATIADANGRFAVFRIFNSGTNPIVRMSNITVRKGQGGLDNGASILNNQGCSLFSAASVVRDNRAAVGGVGIANAGSLTVFRSTVRDNEITGGGGGVTGTGGGILNFSNGRLSIIESATTGNLGIRGGGISNAGSMDITNSTISDSKAPLRCGGHSSVTTRSQAERVGQ